MTIRRHSVAEKAAFSEKAPDQLAAGSVRAPGFLRLVRTIVNRVLRPGAFLRPPNHRRDTLILDAAVLIRSGQLQGAYDLLSLYDRVFTCDPAYLNLLGVINEARGAISIARRFYGVAICSDPSYQPAQMNMRRLYELDTFGHTNLCACLGDVELRTHRAVRSRIHTNTTTGFPNDRTSQRRWTTGP
jgi:hypothetical protein